jgi:hypothetical protein
MLVGGDDNAHFTSADSSPTALAYTVCWALKACGSLDQPLPASHVGNKDDKGNGGDNDGNAGGSGQELNCAPDRDGPPLPPQAVAQQQQGSWVSEGKDNEEGNGDGIKGGKQ